MFKNSYLLVLFIVMMIIAGGCAEVAPIEEPTPTESPTMEPEPEAIIETWKQVYSISGDNTLQNVILAEDGGFLIAGSTDMNFDVEPSSSIYLLKVDENGEIVWEETIDDGGYSFTSNIEEVGENGLLISGAKSSTETDGIDIFIMELDQDHTEVWSEIFGGPLDEFGAGSLLPDGSGFMLGGFIIDPEDFVTNPGAAGYGGFEGRSNIYLSKADNDGNVVWAQSFGGENNMLAFSIVETPDDGYMILSTISYFPESGDDLYLLKVDHNGNEVWSKTWEEASIGAHDLIATSDGNYLISASYSLSEVPSDPKSDFMFIKVDPEGNEIWSTIFGDPDMIDFSKMIVETPDGNIVGAGLWTSDLFGSGEDISLIKLSADGEVLWQNRVSMGSHNMLANLLQHPDGGLVIAGSTVNQGAFDIFLIKTDAEGNFE